MPSGPVDLTLSVRQGIVAGLKAWSPLTTLVSVASIYGEQPPAIPSWPFIRYGFPIGQGYEAQCWSGVASRITVHAFARGPFTDSVYAISRQIVAAVMAPGLVLPDDVSIVDLDWVQTTTLRDTDEADAYHAAVEFDLTAVIVD